MLESNIRQLLKNFNIHPNKTLGQHFLADRGAVAKIIAALEPQPEDTIMEIGPGPGILTLDLAKNCRKVIGIEKDKKMTEVLGAILKENEVPNAEIINQDILQTKICPLTGEAPYKAVGNLPYYITSAIIRKFLENACRPSLMVFTVQKEVAQRICSQPPRMSLLSVSVQYYARPEIIAYIPRKSFRPAPKVDSGIIRLIPFVRPPLEETEKFFRTAKAGFASPRKMLAGNLAKHLGLNRQKLEEIFQRTGLNPKCRAQELSVQNWTDLNKEIPEISGT